MPQSKQLCYLVITPHQVGIVPQSKVQLWIDPSRPGDLQGAYDLLHAQSAEDKTGKARRTEDGFAGSVSSSK